VVTNEAPYAAVIPDLTPAQPPPLAPGATNDRRN
jgi:hypothetical protein